MTQRMEVLTLLMILHLLSGAFCDNPFTPATLSTSSNEANGTISSFTIRLQSSVSVNNTHLIQPSVMLTSILNSTEMATWITSESMSTSNTSQIELTDSNSRTDVLLLSSNIDSSINGNVKSSSENTISSNVILRTSFSDFSQTTKTVSSTKSLQTSTIQLTNTIRDRQESLPSYVMSSTPEIYNSTTFQEITVNKTSTHPLSITISDQSNFVFVSSKPSQIISDQTTTSKFYESSTETNEIDIATTRNDYYYTTSSLHSSSVVFLSIDKSEILPSTSLNVNQNETNTVKDTEILKVSSTRKYSNPGKSTVQDNSILDIREPSSTRLLHKQLIPSTVVSVYSSTYENISRQANDKGQQNNTHKKLYNYSFEIEFTGHCRNLESREALTEIWASLIRIVENEIKTKVKPVNILCEPLRLSFRVCNTNKENLFDVLLSKIKQKKFNITVLVDNSKTVYLAMRIKHFIESDLDSDIFLMGLNEVDIIVIICATTISVILVCAGIIICAREYYMKKRTRSFTLSSYVSNGSKSYDYTLTKMPRHGTSYPNNSMKTISESDGQRSALLPIEEQETSVSDIHIRMNSNESGIIVGVTSTGVIKAEEPTENSNVDTAKEKLNQQKEENDKSVDNPIYYADDDRYLDV